MIRNKILAVAGAIIAFAVTSAAQSPAALAVDPASSCQRPVCGGSGHFLMAMDTSAASGGIQVLYRGHLVSYAKLGRTLGNTYCDDFRGYGKLACFASNRAMEANLLAKGGYAPSEAAVVAHQLGITSRPAATRTATPDVGTCYPAALAELWSGRNKTGSGVALYCNYSNLGSIGWNKRARSGTGLDASQFGAIDFLYSDYNFNVQFERLLLGVTTNMAAIASSEKYLP